MTVSKALNPSPQGPKHGGAAARQMFSNLFSDAIFTKQGKRIRCCAAACRGRCLKTLEKVLLARRAFEAVQSTPTHYSQIVWAVILGASFFHEYPDGLTLVGLAVVGGAGLLTMVREEARLGTVRWNPFSRTRL